MSDGTENSEDCIESYSPEDAEMFTPKDDE